MAYADRMGLSLALADAFWTVITRLDGAERQWRAEQIRREIENGG